MQAQNLNQQSPQPKKRVCISYKPNDFFETFQESQALIISKYQKSAQQLMIQSLTILIDNIRKAGNIQFVPNQNKIIQAKDIHYSDKKNILTFKKQIPHYNQNDEEQSTNPQKQITQFVNFQKTGKKQDKSIKKIELCVQEKEEKGNFAKTKKHEHLLNSLKRLTVSDELKQLQQEMQNVPGNTRQSQQTNLLNYEEILKQKSVSQLIQESNSKIQKDVPFNNTVIESEESDYQITDHQSNQSSNDNNYQERYAFQNDDKPLFGTIFANTGKNALFANFLNKQQNFGDSTQHLPPKPSLSFKPLLNSPKKSKTKKKRLYINKKKVPKWAQNLREVQNIVSSQYQAELRQNSHDTFGVCIIQNLQTNAIFNRNDEYVRASTVKWEKKKGGYVV